LPQQRKKALVEIDRQRLRRSAMADERLDASWRRMKRLGFWFVIIDAKHMKSDFKSDLASK
jgi:hypothetical protein